MNDIMVKKLKENEKIDKRFSQLSLNSNHRKKLLINSVVIINRDTGKELATLRVYYAGQYKTTACLWVNCGSIQFSVSAAHNWQVQTKHGNAVEKLFDKLFEDSAYSPMHYAAIEQYSKVMMLLADRLGVINPIVVEIHS